VVIENIRIGDVIIGVVKDASPNMPIKRSDIVRAVVVRTRHTVLRNDGMSIPSMTTQQ